MYTLKTQDYWKCTEYLDWYPESKLLHAAHPFDEDDTILGCPSCNSINNFNLLCDVVGCEHEVKNGWSSGQGFRRTCFKHGPPTQGELFE